MAESLKVAFYVFSPIGTTVLVVAMVCYTFCRQTNSLIAVYYELKSEAAGAIHFLIKNFSIVTARYLSFSFSLLSNHVVGMKEVSGNISFQRID